MQALPGERIEEPGRIADEQPAPAGPAAHAMADRPGARDGVERRAVAPGGGIVVGRRDARDEPVRDRVRAIAGDLGLPRGPEHDPDVHSVAGHRRDADVAVADDPHPGIASGQAAPGSAR